MHHSHSLPRDRVLELMMGTRDTQKFKAGLLQALNDAATIGEHGSIRFEIED
jgi:hypothetical protein